MPHLFLTDRRSLRRPLAIDGVPNKTPASMTDAVERCGLTDGIPFILDDDGAYDVDLNRFFRDCPTMGVRSPNSLQAYARDILIWMRFLSERRASKSIWQAGSKDIAAFHAARRRSRPPHRISAASWNRSIAALEKFYGWAQEEGLVTSTPFTYRRVWRRPQGGAHAGPIVVSHNRAREPGARHADMRFIALDRFVLFRDVGLRGRLPDGAEDPCWRGRHGERNALFAELVATTGLRLAEASHLLVCELPQPDGFHDREQRLCPFRLPAAVAKGGKAREIRLPMRLLRRLMDYVALERSNALARFIERGGARSTDDVLVAIEAEGKSIMVGDGDGPPQRLRLDLLAPRDRRRLAVDDGAVGMPAPASLWLAETGDAMTPSAWAAVFRRASARCRAFGIDIDVTPHTLRHTFAVHMLSMLIRAQIGMVLKDGPGCEAGAAAYRRMIGDPLQKLQRLMGHASIASTHIYLDSLEESRALIDAAVDRWASELAGADTAA